MLRLFSILLLFVSIIFNDKLIISYNPDDFESKDKDSSINNQEIALQSWLHSFNSTKTDIIKQSKEITYQTTFYNYCQQLSDIYQYNHAYINFMSIGACDGTHDMILEKVYLTNDHWNGMLIEPSSHNYDDLVRLIQTKRITHRTLTLHAAVTDVCNENTIQFKVSKYDITKPNEEHWLRRQVVAYHYVLDVLIIYLVVSCCVNLCVDRSYFAARFCYH